MKSNLLKIAKMFFCFLVVISGIVFTTGTGKTYSYLTAHDKTVNVVTVGNTEGYIDEVFPSNIIEPEKNIEKKVSVVNNGRLPAFVRVKIVWFDSTVEALATLHGIDETLWCYCEEDGYYYSRMILLPGKSIMFMESISFDIQIKDALLDNLEHCEVGVYTELFQHEAHDGGCSENEYREIWRRMEGT